MPGLDFKLYCLPEQAPVDTLVHVETGWSVTTDAPCWVVRAENVRGAASSQIVTQGYPADCVVLPEPPMGLWAGLCLLLILWRHRANQGA